MKKYNFVDHTVKSALREYYRLSLKKKLTDNEKATMNGIKYSIVGLSVDDIPDHIKEEIKKKENYSDIPYAK